VLEGGCLANYGRAILPGAGRPGQEVTRVFKIMRLNDSPSIAMERGRGEQIKLINASLGTDKIDVHLNRLTPGEPGGSLHHHSTADNVYIVRRGEGTLVIEGKTYTIRSDDVVFIPAGTRHALANRGADTLEIFEIYAPAGKHFDFVLDE
jgi:mannose-6-phosphate isomerase-like protein (cupin superfamily)